MLPREQSGFTLVSARTSTSAHRAKLELPAGFTSALDSIIFTLYSSPALRLDPASDRLAQLRLPAEPALPLTPPAAVCARLLPASALIHPRPLAVLPTSATDSPVVDAAVSNSSLGRLLYSQTQTQTPATHLHRRRTHSLPCPRFNITAPHAAAANATWCTRAGSSSESP